MQHQVDCGPSTDRPYSSITPSSSSSSSPLPAPAGSVSTNTTPTAPPSSSLRRHSVTLIPRIQSGISSIFNSTRMRNVSASLPRPSAPNRAPVNERPPHPPLSPSSSSHQLTQQYPPSTSSSSPHHSPSSHNNTPSRNNTPTTQPSPPPQTSSTSASAAGTNGRMNADGHHNNSQQDWSSGSSSPERNPDDVDEFLDRPPTELVIQELSKMYLDPDDGGGGGGSGRHKEGNICKENLRKHEGWMEVGSAGGGAHEGRGDRDQHRSDKARKASSAAPKRRQYSPIERLPVEILFNIFQKLLSPADHFNCILVCRKWADCNIELLWHRPYVTKAQNLVSLIQALERNTGLYPYASLIKRLNLNFLAENISDGTMQPLAKCHRLERLTLTNCRNVTDQGLAGIIPNNKGLLTLDLSHLEEITDSSLYMVAENCKKLQGLNIAGCLKVNDDALIEVSRNCTTMKRLKLNDCSLVTDKSVLEFANNCPQLVEIDLQKCFMVTDDAILAAWNKLPQLRELRLAYCENLTDQAFLPLPNRNFESLRILDLTRCSRITDQTVFKIVNIAPRLRNLVLAKCGQLTDKAVEAITKLGKNLHFLHLGHCMHLTDASIATLVKYCKSIRYIDLANCTHLTDAAVMSLATLPKLRRIGLVKCQKITDAAIMSLLNRNQMSVCALERVHLSYCLNLTVNCIHQLLNRCTKLTHLSLTGVEVFCGNPELTQFCRSPPVDFNEVHQRLFCVFSGTGVVRLRNYLNQTRELPAEPAMHRQGLGGHYQESGSTPPLGTHNHSFSLPNLVASGPGRYTLQPIQMSHQSFQQYQQFQQSELAPGTHPVHAVLPVLYSHQANFNHTQVTFPQVSDGMPGYSGPQLVFPTNTHPPGALGPSYNPLPQPQPQPATVNGGGGGAQGGQWNQGMQMELDGEDDESLE